MATNGLSKFLHVQFIPVHPGAVICLSVVRVVSVKNQSYRANADDLSKKKCALVIVWSLFISDRWEKGPANCGAFGHEIPLTPRGNVSIACGMSVSNMPLYDHRECVLYNREVCICARFAGFPLLVKANHPFITSGPKLNALVEFSPGHKSSPLLGI